MDIEKLSLNYFKSRPYKIFNSFPLLTDEPTLLFNNSTIAPFKKKLLSGEKIEKIFLLQNCFRHHYHGVGLFGFKMLGTLGLLNEIEEMQYDFINFLESVIGFKKRRLHAVLNKNHTLLLKNCQKLFSNNNIHFIKDKKNTKYATEWQFGEGDLLTGKGLTIVAESNGIKKCSSECNIFCACNYYFPLGNFILIQSKKEAYFEIGFGVESIEASLGKGDYYAVDPYNLILSYFIEQGFKYDISQELTRHYAGGAILTAENISQGNKGSQYIFKKMIRKIYETIINSGVPLSQVETLLRNLIQKT